MSKCPRWTVLGAVEDEEKLQNPRDFCPVGCVMVHVKIVSAHYGNSQIKD